MAELKRKRAQKDSICLLTPNNYKSERYANISQHSSIARNTRKQPSVALCNEILEKNCMLSKLGKQDTKESDYRTLPRQGRVKYSENNLKGNDRTREDQNRNKRHRT
ncbi:hypothetical protein STEG23_033752 [Scotinomys teguina]